MTHVRRRRIVQSTLVILCYLLWTGVVLGVTISAGLWVVTRLFGDGSDTSSAYEVIADNAAWLLAGSAVLAVVAGAVSWWTDRVVD